MLNEVPKFKALIIFAAAIILIAGISLRIVNFNNVSRRSGDERIYTKQAKVICDEGPVKGTRILVQEFNGTRQLWIYPTPTRIGYDWLLAAVMKISKSDDIALGSYISFTASVLSLVLVAVIGLRFFNPMVALFAVLFMAVSAPELAIARRTWQDALFGLIGLLTIYCSLEIVKNLRKITWYVLFVLTGSYLLLVKESGLIIFGLSALWILWNLLVKERSFTKCLIFVTACIIGSAASYALLSYSSGGLSQYLEVYGHIKEVVGTSSYGREYQSGPWVNFISGLSVISPLSYALFLVGAAGTLVSFRHNTSEDMETRRRAIWLILFSIIFFTVFLILPDSQNYRFVSIIFAPFYIIAGFGLWSLLELIRPFVKNISVAVMPLLAIVIILAALWDYQTFTSILSNSGAIDLPVKTIMHYSK